MMRVKHVYIRKIALFARLSGVILFAWCGFFALRVYAVSPDNILSYQGRLLNAHRVPVADATATMIFELYTASSGGSCVWSNSSATCASATGRTVNLTDGLFSENLGDTSASYAAIGDAIFSDNSTLYLQITINGETLSPRKRIVAAPYALNADTLDGLDADADGATIAAIVAYNSSGNVVFTGNPGDSTVSGGSVYINPALVDVSTDDTLLGIAVGGTEKFRIDAEGNTVFTDALSVSSDRMGHVVTNSVVTGTWGAGLGDAEVSVLHLTSDYRAHEAAGTDGVYYGAYLDTKITDTGDLNELYGLYAASSNQSSNASAVEKAMYGVLGEASNQASVTIPKLYGVMGSVSASAGTVTDGYGVYGSLSTGAGAFTNGYGGFFSNLAEGTYRVGVYGTAAGGMNNYSGYFTQAIVVIDNDDDFTNSGPTNIAASEEGDLYVVDSVEVDGSFYAGDTAGSDEFVFTSSEIGASIFTLNVDYLTTGTGMEILRSNSQATDFDGTLFNIEQNRSSATSDGTVMALTNMGGGNASALYITQSQVGNATTAPTAQALVIDVDEAASNDEVILIRSDADNSSGLLDTEFRFENDGDAFADGAWNAAGADYAEFFPVEASSAPKNYELVCVHPGLANGVKRCAAGERNVMGVVSTNPGFIGNRYTGAEMTLEGNPHYALVGLVGQISTLASADTGPIAIGDVLTTSMVRAGYAAKADGATYIIGRALEPLPSGTGVIKVLVQPMWHGASASLSLDGDVPEFSSGATLTGPLADATHPLRSSSGLSFAASRWNGTDAEIDTLALQNVFDARGDSQLALQHNNGLHVMTFGSTGNLAIAGNFYPSDRGVLQYGAYVYYDGRGSGYMTTNASGWASPMHGIAESFASALQLEAGEVVELAVDGSVEPAAFSSSRPFVGVVAEHAGFVAGTREGMYEVTISGRVRVRVSTKSASFLPGDALIVASELGTVMKGTAQSGQLVGYALEAWDGNEAMVEILLNTHGQTLTASSVVPGVQLQNMSTLNISDSLVMNGGSIFSVGKIQGIGDRWSIDDDGNIMTRGLVTQLVPSLQGTDVATFATTATEQYVQLAGSILLQNGVAHVVFDEYEPTFNDVISPDFPYQVLVTPQDVTGQIYVSDRSNVGFFLHDVGGGSGVAVDWLVVAYRHDAVPNGRVSRDIYDNVFVDEGVVDEYSSDSVQNEDLVVEIDIPLDDDVINDVSSFQEEQSGDGGGSAGGADTMTSDVYGEENQGGDREAFLETESPNDSLVIQENGEDV